MINRKLIVALSIIGLIAIFLFQQFDFALWVGINSSDVVRFIINRSFRFILNDGLTIALIYGLFGQRKYVIFSIYVQLVGLLLILIPYFILKLNYPLYNGPLINFIHRLVLNPLLLLLLIPAFYYQQRISQQ
jgi:exosortase F-associated protein